MASCLHSYFMTLLVNSNLKANANDSTGRAEPDVLLITHADIRLMDKGQATLSFVDKDNQPIAELPEMERVPAIPGVDIAGPFNVTGVGDTESRRRVFICHPAS